MGVPLNNHHGDHAQEQVAEYIGTSDSTGDASVIVDNDFFDEVSYEVSEEENDVMEKAEESELIVSDAKHRWLGQKKLILCLASHCESLDAQCGKIFYYLFLDEINRKCAKCKTTFLRPKTLLVKALHRSLCFSMSLQDFKRH